MVMRLSYFCSLQIIANNYVQIWLQSASAMSLLVCELLMIVNPCSLFFSSLTGCGTAVSLLGVAYFANIQHLAYFIVAQILSGMMQV